MVDKPTLFVGSFNDKVELRVTSVIKTKTDEPLVGEMML